MPPAREIPPSPGRDPIASHSPSASRDCPACSLRMTLGRSAFITFPTCASRSAALSGGSGNGFVSIRAMRLRRSRACLISFMGTMPPIERPASANAGGARSRIRRARPEFVAAPTGGTIIAGRPAENPAICGAKRRPSRIAPETNKSGSSISCTHAPCLQNYSRSAGKSRPLMVELRITVA